MSLISFEFPVYSLSRPLNANDINVIMWKGDGFLWNLTIFKHNIRHENPMISSSKNGTPMDIALKFLTLYYCFYFFYKLKLRMLTNTKQSFDIMTVARYLKMCEPCHTFVKHYHCHAFFFLSHLLTNCKIMKSENTEILQYLNTRVNRETVIRLWDIWNYWQLATEVSTNQSWQLNLDEIQY